MARFFMFNWYCWWKKSKQPPRMYKTLYLMGYLPYQLVQDFSQQHMENLYMTNFTHWNAGTMGLTNFFTKDEFWFPKKKQHHADPFVWSDLQLPRRFLRNKTHLSWSFTAKLPKRKTHLREATFIYLYQTTTFSITIESKHIFDDPVILS